MKVFVNDASRELTMDELREAAYEYRRIVVEEDISLLADSRYLEDGVLTPEEEEYVSGRMPLSMCVTFAAALLHTHPGKELGDISAARVSLKTLEGLSLAPVALDAPAKEEAPAASDDAADAAEA